MKKFNHLFTKLVRGFDRLLNGGTDTDDGYAMLRFATLCALGLLLAVSYAAIVSLPKSDQQPQCITRE